ncbi:uncharacterized protein PHACADRAFT_206736 [Phanerochaete carnosa HHB-10118-sp]|uniref:Hypervirulence associated protein TUDOR domain-containing protein n=1 Tax=Phanerochaete carnosa (strain HHB-10118-sp) TaxID=650164 RepID=K5V5F5_PHACS|nr:uncharacterized protein PHACADRAFT_206736 [Phanerochaete carnosa HHB-10118-sp]EKM57866.1 hypothetical protein PHACADRAFT_206736 [Phanerochaete carnosa HHB-10118-sp]
MSGYLKDKDGEPIQEGDKVFTRFRSGKREGEVEQIVTNGDEAAKISDINVKNPPKVSFSDQDCDIDVIKRHGHNVAHNPGTLSHTD